MTDSSHPQGQPPEDLESTVVLLARIRKGDERARNQLIARHLPALQRWAHGRLPAGARDLSQTDDLVQVTFMSALQHLEGFEHRHEGAFMAYLRRILLNKVRDEIRKAKRRPGKDEFQDEFPGNLPSPLDEAISEDTLNAYERALQRLPEHTRQAVILRLEFGYTYEQVARAVNNPSANAIRMRISRALVQIAEEIHGTEDGGASED